MSNLKNLYTEERQEQILKYLEEHKKISVVELSNYSGVSKTTIRSDLDKLDSNGLIKRTHGGALSFGKSGFEPKFDEKSVNNPKEKSDIAQFSAEFIEDGDTVALDTGTTTLAVARLLIEKRNLTIITNDIKIAAYLEDNAKESSIILVGGTLRIGYNCTVGPAAQNFLKSHFVDKAFIACDGFSLKEGITTPNDEQAELKRILIDIANEVIVVCDSTKLERAAFVKVCDIKKIDALVTDAKAENTLVEKYKNAGIKVFTADRGNLG